MEPFLKWAGGKRWLTSKFGSLLPDKQAFNNYFEPFLGGGAVFFHLQPDNAVLSDLNGDLINAYRAIRDNWAELIPFLEAHHRNHCPEYYYETRSARCESSVGEAARFIYLNRTCWNGLYRVNRKGEFNVPIGTKTRVILPNDNFEAFSNILKDKIFEVCDFEKTIQSAQERDFLFVDPPYTVKHNLNGFVKYNENIFSWEDQVRLNQCIKEAISRGVYVLILNAHHESIMDLYRGMGTMMAVDRASVIAGSSEARGVYSELVVKCW